MKYLIILIGTLSISIFSQSTNKVVTKKSIPKKVKTIVFIGDSLTQGYGVSKNESYPALIEAKLNQTHTNTFKIINGSISGSTSASAVGRLKWFKKVNPDIVIIALGANDGLRGLKINETKQNLSKAIKYAQNKKMNILLAGMMVPPNYGKNYEQSFKKIFPELAKKYKVKLIPFLLMNVAGEKELNQSDGIHPNAKGQKIVAQTVYPYISELL